MTLPHERTRAVMRADRAIQELLPYVLRAERGAKHVRVPREVLRLFYRLLKHYPTGYDLELSAIKCPKVWGRRCGPPEIDSRAPREWYEDQ
jgi:hypothetical protein